MFSGLRAGLDGFYVSPYLTDGLHNSFSGMLTHRISSFAQAAAQSSTQMYVFRFMVGFFESAFSPIIIFLLGSWYTKAELAKRVAVWHITGFFGQATSGFLQAGIHASLNGRLGLAGWRWLYISESPRSTAGMMPYKAVN